MNFKTFHLFCLIFFVQTLVYAQNTTKDICQTTDLINRVLPYHQTNFVLEIIPEENGKDVFEVDKKNGIIVLRGNNSNSLAVAFNTYLKEIALISYSWQAYSPIEIRQNLPLPQHLIRHICTARERFFNNTCTFGYTYAYWNWEQWQRFIDWMAMNGINRPLMLAGQEAVWLEVWQSFGLTETQICSYFSSPTHLPWHRMCNMDRWGGPLPLSYINKQKILQKQILDRCRSLNMKPILSAFAGHVPAELRRLYPNAKISTIEPGWGGMDSVYTTCFIDPHESLFAEIQKRFLTVQKEFYGSDNLYSADPFNEITPPSWGNDYLASVSKAIYQSIANVDSLGVWYQMSWTFYNDSAHWTQPRLAAMIHEVPKGKLVFLDYNCEEEEYFRRSNNFQGAPFIWCYLGNFGGNTHLVAPLHKVLNRLKNVRQNDGCLGVGSTLEGVNVNPVIYEMTLQAPWMDSAEMNVENFIQKYADRRAGYSDPEVREAWNILSNKVLLDKGIGIWNHSIIYQVVPVLDLKNRFWSTNPDYPYKNADLSDAISHLLCCDEKAKQSDAYQFDLVNLTRQLLGNYGLDLYHQMIDAYGRKDVLTFKKTAMKFLALGYDIDTLLGTRPEFLIGNWLADAKNTGDTSEEKAYYVRDAREIITTWHKAGGGLTDYSNRQWNGLMRTYYMPRWKEFVKQLESCLHTGKNFDEVNFKKWCADFEQNWVDKNKEIYPKAKQGSAVKMATFLFRKYNK